MPSPHAATRRAASALRRVSPRIAAACFAALACALSVCQTTATFLALPAENHRTIVRGAKRSVRAVGGWVTAPVSGILALASTAAIAASASIARSRLAGVTSAGRGRKAALARSAEPMMPWKIPNSSRWQWLSVRELLLRERILMVTSYIDENFANANLAMLLYLQSEDAKKPIQIYFAVPGADLKPALALYDTIGQLKARGCTVSTVSYSLCAGMGAFLVAAGSPGRRFATPNSVFRLSKEGLASPIQGQAADIEVEAMQVLRDSARVEKALSEMTGRPLEKVQKDLNRDFYLSATEAAEYGIVDRVLSPQLDKGEKLDRGVRDPWSGQVTREKVGFGVFADPNQPRTAV
mmetsp:Transcript_6358/g.14043  ORF Transcript_6358/g.14043 Transcript_6358/m.14043 type:complete len:351 (+) Transcript_6358:120-1172(+)